MTGVEALALEDDEDKVYLIGMPGFDDEEVEALLTYLSYMKSDIYAFNTEVEATGPGVLVEELDEDTINQIIEDHD